MLWLLALISDTGLRLSDAAGLHRDNLVLHHGIPYLFGQAHPWRTLTTSASERKVTLVSSSLWTAQRILSEDPHRVFALPRYNRSQQTNGNSASAALDIWL